MSTDLTNLQAVLSFLAGPAGIVAWMVFVSDWIRNATERGTIKLDGWRLQLLSVLASFLPPLIAFVILNLVPPETLALASPYYAFAAMCFLAYIAQAGWFNLKSKTSTTVSVSVPGAKPATATAEAQPPQSVSVNVGAPGPPPADG